MALPLHLLPRDVADFFQNGTLVRDFRAALEEIPHLPLEVTRWHTYEDSARLQDGTWSKVFRDGVNRYTILSRYRGYNKGYQAGISSKQPPYTLYTLTPEGVTYYGLGVGNELELQSFEEIVQALRDWAMGNKTRSSSAVQGRYSEPISESEDAESPSADDTGSADVTISWSPQEGLIVYTSSRKFNEILKKYHLKWSRYHEAWYAQGSKGQNRPPPRIGPNHLKYDLERAGAVVALNIGEPVSEQELAQIRLEKAERGVEYAESKARKATREAEGHFKRGHEISQRFEFGQPILVGHHSEAKARRDQERMHNAARRGSEAYDKAEHYEQKASSLSGVATVQERIASGQTASDLEKVKQIVQAIRDMHPKKTLGLERMGIKAPQESWGKARVWADFSKDGETATAHIYGDRVTYTNTSLSPSGDDKYEDGASVQSIAEMILNGIRFRLQKQRDATIRAIAEERRKSVEDAVRSAFESTNWATYKREPKSVLTDTEQYIKDRTAHFQALLDQSYDEVRKGLGRHSSVADMESALRRKVYQLAKEERGG